MKKIIFLFLIFSIQIVFATTKINTISSFSILGDIVNQIGKDKILVTNIVKEDSSIHSYNLSPADIKSLVNAKIIFINGLNLESNAFINAIKDSKTFYVIATDGILPIVNHGDISKPEAIKKLPPQYHKNHIHYLDPHVWQDPILVIQYVKNIAQGLIKIDPANKDFYLSNLKEYTKKLNDLDILIKKQVDKIPINKRNVLISHNYLNYFARRYKLNVFSVEGLSEDAQVSAKKISDIINLVKDKNINAIFVENIGNPNIMQQISNETHKKISGKLYTDALSKNKEANNYLNLIKYNLNQIVKALSNQ